ncbi:hypothetical protein BDQ12DRAFT_721869 [Crucibulum laeve]|uniref:G-protein coupled receptors family 1 profile domain-containing protein n=1 Tax=Crucibulum laeve TaxID=68775 RepID=A0A5C3MH04_9AGAR|nr:hypothetical protein BDQ12DRAFT_721869 [Crucibulum laeve]
MDASEAQFSSSQRLLQITIFDALAFLAVFLVGAVLATALFSRKVNRRRPWYNMLVSWLVYSASYLLLVGFQGDKGPPFWFCFLQAVFVYGAPPLAAFGTACYIVDLYLSVSSLHVVPRKPTSSATLVLLFIPWVAFISVIIEISILVTRDPSSVKRSPGLVYCHLDTTIQVTSNVALGAIAGVILVPLEIWIAILLRKSRTKCQEFEDVNPQSKQLSLLIRSAVFTAMVLIGVALNITACWLNNQRIVIWSIFLPTAPILLAISFGTQRDIMTVWAFWKKSPTLSNPPVDNTRRVQSQPTDLTSPSESPC